MTYGASGELAGEPLALQSARLQGLPTGLAVEVVVVPPAIGAADTSPGRKPWDQRLY
jgi:hypothetical protein